ncbi:MAG: post-transcriptional regulator [Coprobacillus sp.]
MEIDLKNNLPLDILFLMRVKANEFKSEGIHTIKSEDIKEYLYTIKWKDEDTLVMCDMINDIMSLHFSEVFDYLKLKVIKEASSMKIDDFSELIAK